jgi:hypothetical protein
MKLFRRVRPSEAERVLAGGFENHTGTYLTDREWTGVWVSDRALDCNEGIPLAAIVLLEIQLHVPEAAIADYEWVEEEKTYREWLLPAVLLNRYASVRMVGEDEEMDDGFLLDFDAPK